MDNEDEFTLKIFEPNKDISNYCNFNFVNKKHIIGSVRKKRPKGNNYAIRGDSNVSTTRKYSDSDEPSSDDMQLHSQEGEETTQRTSSYSNKHNSGFLQENDDDDNEDSSDFEDSSDDNHKKSSVTVMKLAKQSNLYKKSSIAEEYNIDTMQCIQRYLKRIYRQVKFFSDTKEDYKEPCFITEEGRKKQTVVLCEWILQNINRKNDTLEEKIRFWMTYRKQIKMELNRMRQTDMNTFSKKFKKGTYNNKLSDIDFHVLYRLTNNY